MASRDNTILMIVATLTRTLGVVLSGRAEARYNVLSMYMRDINQTVMTRLE